MTVNLSSLAGAGQQFFSNSGAVLTGGKLYSYAAGTTTPQTTYTTYLGNVAHTNPIVLDSSGRISTGEIWITAGVSYKFVLTDSNDVLIATWDNITGINGTGIATNAVNVQYDPAGTGAVSTNVQAKLRQTINIKDFGAVGDGTTDDTNAINAAIAANNGNVLWFPSGTYKITSRIDFGNVGIEGQSERGSVSSFGGVEFSSYVVGDYALTVASYRGQTYRKFTVKSYLSNQSGICVLGMHPIVEEVRVEGFDKVSFRVGTGSLATIVPSPTGIAATGCYYAKIDNIYITNSTVTGSNALRGLFNDGGFPSTNANTYRNVVVNGRFDILYELNGTNNSLYGGDCDPSNTIATCTAAYKIGGLNIRVHEPYYELNIPTYLYWFASTAYSCEVLYPHFQSATSNIYSKVLDEGWGNNVQFLPIGYNFPFPQANKSNQNLISNNNFRSWNPSAFGTPAPSGWVAVLGTWTQDSTTTRGGAFSVKSTVAASRANLAFYIATTSTAVSRGPSPRQISINDIRGKTLVAAVWCKSSVATLGNIKISGTSVGSVGPNTHTGSGNWELLTAFAKIDAAATDVTINLRSDQDGTNKTGDVWFSEPVCFFGVDLTKEEPRPLTDNIAQMFGPMYLSPFQLFTDLATTPDVSQGNCFTITNSAPTTITNFVPDATRFNGQIIYLLPTNGNTTVKNNANINTSTGADITLSANTVYRFINNGTKWYQI